MGSKIAEYVPHWAHATQVEEIPKIHNPAEASDPPLKTYKRKRKPPRRQLQIERRLYKWVKLSKYLLSKKRSLLMLLFLSLSKSM